MPVDLSEARLKLARGREHTIDLKTRIARFHSTDFYSLRVEPVEGGRRARIVLDSLHQPDKNINAVIGDAIGNLRSALDYVAVAIVAPITGSSEHVGFPFADNDKGFAGTVTSKNSFMAAPIVTDLMINEIQAYKGGKGEALWVLNKLRNIDKHRFLITAIQMAGIRFSATFFGGGRIDNGFCGVAAGETATMIDFGPDFKFTKQPTAAFQVVFNEPAVAQMIPVVDFLDRAASQVEAILQPLEVLLN